MYIAIVQYFLAYLVKILKYITTDRFLFTERFHAEQIIYANRGKNVFYT